MNKLIFYILTLMILTSCFKEDDPYPAFEMQTTTIEMGQYYRYQSYFNLASNEVVSSNDRNIWDLGFENGDSSFHITLNTSCFPLAANTGMTDFEQVTDTTGLDWRFDKSDGNPDSTAIGEWFFIEEGDTLYPNYVYVINRGYDHVGNLRGLKKIIFTHVDSSSYSFQYCDMNGENLTEFTVNKTEGVYFTSFSFDDGGSQTDLEPLLLSWDLFFTQYTTLLYTNEGDPYPYLVTGVLSNYPYTEMAMDTLREYADIDQDYARTIEFSSTRDLIGYEWKELIGDVNTGNVYYEVVEGRTYLVKTRLGMYFKLRFISFYSENGEKGYPTFQYDLL